MPRQVFEVTDAASIQTQVNAAASAGNKAVVHIPVGTYNMPGTVTIPSGASIQIIGDGLGTKLNCYGGYTFSCANAENLHLDGFYINGQNGAGNGLDLRIPDTLSKIALFESVTSHRATSVGYRIEGFATTRTEMHSVGLSGDGVLANTIGMQVIGTGTSSGEVVLFSGSSSNIASMYQVLQGGKLLVQAVWYESNNLPAWVNLSGKGSFTANCMKVFASYNPTDAITVDNFDGVASFIGLHFNGRFVVKGTGTTTVTGNLAAQVDTPNQYTNTSPNAVSASVANRLFTNGVGSFGQADIGTVSASHLTSMLAQLKTVKPKYKDTPVGLYIHRVLVENGATNFHLRPTL